MNPSDVARVNPRPWMRQIMTGAEPNGLPLLHNIHALLGEAVTAFAHDPDVFNVSALALTGLDQKAQRERVKPDPPQTLAV